MTAILLPDRTIGTTIPRWIYQTYPTHDLPPALHDSVVALRAANPEWQYRLFDDADIRSFITEYYGRPVTVLYDRIGDGYGAARADLFRYLLIYAKGGVYLDVKSRFTIPIDEAIRPTDRFILAHWRNTAGGERQGWGLHEKLRDIPGGEFQQWHVIAAPGHPFLKAVIEHVLDNIERYSVKRNDVGWTGVLDVTGPIAYTRTIAPLVDRYPCRICEDETLVGLEYNVLGGSAHKSPFGRHYTERTNPVVRQPGIRGWIDRLHVEARRRRKALAARREARTIASR